MAFNISGTVYTDAGITPIGSGKTVAVSVNGGAISITTTTASDGTFTLTGVVGTSIPVAVFLRGNTEKGVSVIAATGNVTDLTGVRIYQDSLVFQRPTGSSGSASGANINTSDNSGDSDITAIYSSSSNTLYTMAAGKHIYALDNSTAGTGAIINGGNVDFSGSSSSQNVNLTFVDSGIITGRSSSVPAAGTLTINCPGGTVSLGGNLRVTTITLTNGTLDATVNNYSITVSSWTATNGLFNSHSNSVSLTGTVLSTNNQAFYDLNISGSGTVTITTTGLTVTNNISNTSPKTLSTSGSSFPVTVGGNWSNTGTFAANNGTVTFNGNDQIISGNTSFYDLVKNTSSACSLIFTDGTTQTISNSLTFNGASGQLLTLTGSGSSGWNINVPSTQNLDYLAVDHSNNIGTLATATNSIDNGDNTNWSFSGATAVEGTLTQTLEDVTLSSTAQVIVKGTLNQTLEDVALSSQGKVIVSGTLNQTLESVSLSGTATIRTSDKITGIISIRPTISGEISIAPLISGIVSSESVIYGNIEINPDVV